MAKICFFNNTWLLGLILTMIPTVIIWQWVI